MRSQAVPSAIINRMIQAPESRLPDISRPRKGCVVGNPALQPGHMQYAAFGVHLVDFHPVSLRYALGMPEHQEQPSNAGVVGGAGAANGGCCHANFHLWARSTITSDSGGTPVCGFICTMETGKNR